MIVLVILLVVAAFLLVVFDMRRGDRRAAKVGQAFRQQRAAARSGNPARSAASRKPGDGR
jgi:type II secretory pathway pseudopilin PulG